MSRRVTPVDCLRPGRHASASADVPGDYPVRILSRRRLRTQNEDIAEQRQSAPCRVPWTFPAWRPV